ncbi:MAG: FeoA family protein [bacterium]|nr:FeoA family protein [bacterium]
MTTLSQLRVGQSATIMALNCDPRNKQLLMNMGLVPTSTITVSKVAPFGDPIEIQLQHNKITLRKNEAEAIQVDCHD